MEPEDRSTLPTLKVAVALAVLKNKPPGVSGRNYAESLSQRFKNSQQHWKHQYEKAQTEILHLKQQLVMHKQTQPCVMEPEDSLPSDSQSLFPTPPPSGSTSTSQIDNAKPCTVEVQSSLSKHTEFLHHLINIKTASSVLTLKGSLEEITQQSLLHSLHLLQNHLGGSNVSWRVQEQCVKYIVALMDKCDKILADNIIERVCDLCASIIKDIMSSSEQDYKILEHKSQLLVTIGESRHFTALVLNLLCDCLLTFSDDLRKSAQTGKFPDPIQFCNSYYIFQAIEHCLGKMRELSSEEKMNVKTKLEDSLLHITEKFPLFAHAVWRICGYIF